MFPDTWDQQKIMEEISLAFSNKYYTGQRNQWRGVMSNGGTCILCLRENNTIINNDFRIITVWPEYRLNP